MSKTNVFIDSAFTRALRRTPRAWPGLENRPYTCTRQRFSTKQIDGQRLDQGLPANQPPGHGATQKIGRTPQNGSDFQRNVLMDSASTRASQRTPRSWRNLENRPHAAVWQRFSTKRADGQRLDQGLPANPQGKARLRK